MHWFALAQPERDFSIRSFFYFSGRDRKDPENQPVPEAPKVAYQEPGLPPQYTVQEISLVSVGEIEVWSGLLIFKNQPGVKLDARKQRLFPTGNAGVKRITLRGKPAGAFGHIVITVQEVQTLIFIKSGKYLEGAGMCLFDGGKRTIFPKLVAVSKLDISEIIFIVIAKSGSIQVLVF